MNAFQKACQVETEALKDIVPFIRAQSDDGRYVLTNKGRLSREMQKKYGDAVAETTEGIVTVEFKAESECATGNLFLETWSNRSRFTLGWMYTLNADILLYYFLAERMMLSISFQNLRKWAFHKGRIYQFDEKPQGRYAQLNDTWGRCVPMDVIRKEVGYRRYHFDGDGDFIQEE